MYASAIKPIALSNNNEVQLECCAQAPKKQCKVKEKKTEGSLACRFDGKAVKWEYYSCDLILAQIDMNKVVLVCQSQSQCCPLRSHEKKRMDAATPHACPPVKVSWKKKTVLRKKRKKYRRK